MGNCCSGRALQSAQRLGFTRREIEVAREVALGKRTGDIAHTFSITRKTVYFHSNNICKKIGSECVRDAIHRLIILGFADSSS